MSVDTNHRLDPPVRSRFQIRRVDSVSSDALYEQLVLLSTSGSSSTVDSVNTDQAAKQLAVFASSMTDASSGGNKSLHFPVTTALPSILRVRRAFPQQAVPDLLQRAFPYASTESRLRAAVDRWPAAVTARETMNRVCQELGIVHEHSQQQAPYEVDHVEGISEDSNHVQVHFRSPTAQSLFGTTLGGDPTNAIVQVTVPSGGAAPSQPSSNNAFVSTTGSRQVMTAMLQEHAVGRDILLVSPKGEGKNALAEHFAAVTGYHVHLFPLYKEMTATDLLLRLTSASTESQRGWAESPLLQAARTGQVCILDGIEKLSRDTLATLQGFLTDREIFLPDGTKLVHTKGDEAMDSDLPMGAIHPSFRVIALASISAFGSRSPHPTWLSEEATSMFSTIALPAPSRQCLKDILQPHNTLVDSDVDKLLEFHERLLTAAEDCGVSPLSIRTMVRLVKRCHSADGSNLYDNICSSLLVELLTPTQRAALESVLRSSGIVGPKKSKKKIRREDRAAALKVAVDGNKLSIGDFVMDRRESKNAELVPSPFFFDIPSHVQMIQSLLSEWSIGERAFLLLGNQGTGKNKICDRICELANFEREYMQLHRDSTIGQLTLSPSIEDGKIVWKDSPLVRAVTEGRALVIDEADKAPLEVVAVLKSLVEDGELLLADGRRILRHRSEDDESKPFDAT
jgi:von Willebrand factor A domain-containing protein 8